MPRGRPRKIAAAAAPASVAPVAAPSTAAPTTTRRGRANNQPQVRFAHKLVLNQWLLSLFHVRQFNDLAAHLRNEDLEGLDENNIHRFHHALTGQLFNLTQLPVALLLDYDQNIVRHTLQLNERRVRRGEQPIVWKYFQYLTLLFTEIYLDRYFSDPKALLAELNIQVTGYNADKADADKIALHDETGEAWPQLNKVAYWSATGSGKTLLMHANILQYQFYLSKHGRRHEVNRILLLTPNDGLSQQHLQEFEAAGIAAELFQKDGRRMFSGQFVEILDIHKLKDEMGEKTVAVAAFEGNNLVLVDEGHRGASGGESGTWMRYRNALCERGFSFEYSATFGQAVKNDKPLTDLYAKNILFDYSYRYFYEDGFGKDFLILNLDEGTQSNNQELYLVACLLSFFQQQRLFREHGTAFRPFNLEKPLWVFVGGSVTATLATKDASDIVEILKFLAGYVADRSASVQNIHRILNQGLITDRGKDLFAGRFVYLNSCGLTPAQIFDDTLRTLFNAPAGGQLYVENLKGAVGEIALRLGSENEAFGVVNVGDDSKLITLCEANGLETGQREFSGSLFLEINSPHSSVNILIGSKKFTEGWSSWRVSTMGLMNVGRGEGAQIIQLFGRGVRLKGHGISLKRSAKAQLPYPFERPRYIGVLETLGIFGIHADYMAQFREFLRDAGLPANEERVEVLMPVIRNLGTQGLKTIRLKSTINGVSTGFGDAFRRLAPVPSLAKPDPALDPSTEYLLSNQVVLNWYPKIQDIPFEGLDEGSAKAPPNATHLKARHLAFVDVDQLWFELERFKAERGWYNLNLTRAGIEALLADTSWYSLLIPEIELEFHSFEKVVLWHEIALSLLKKYTERYYTFRKREWELPHLEYRDLEASDPNFMGSTDDPAEGYYRILIESSQQEIVAKLEELKSTIQSGQLKPWEFHGMNAIWFERHLYQPLLHLDRNVVEISPAALNDGERRFVEDLKAFYEATPEFFKIRQLYLLRNLSKGRGIGFFEAGNFHPDFILWLVQGGKQRITFVDPKGIRNLSATDPKIQFYKTIKEIEQRLADPNVELQSFIVSNTPSVVMRTCWSMDKIEMQKHHVLFQQEDQDTYIGALLGAGEQNISVAQLAA